MDLSKISTRKLLNMREYPWPSDPEDDVLQEQIRAELNTREHIPNKLEARMLRSKSTNKKKVMLYGR